MGKKLIIDEDTLIGIANSIRAKKNMSGTINLDSFAQEIEDIIENGAVIQDGEETIEILGQYEGIKYNINSNGVTNIKKMIQEEKKIPLEFIVESDNEEKKIIEKTISSYESNEIFKIGDYAFYSCTSLTTVNFPQCEYIGNYAFQNCTSLTEVSFPMCSYIGTCAFYSCSSLQEANSPLCTSIGIYAFRNCSSLSAINFPQCSYIGNYAFSNCTSLTEVSSPVCEYIGGYAFNNCKSLSSLYLVNSLKIASLYNTNAFTGTPIASGTGKIYVHADQYDNYISATNWVNFSSQFVSVNSEV